MNDNFLCFGTRTAPAISNTLSQAIVRIMRQTGKFCWGYLDDFLLGSLSMEQGCQDLLDLIKVVRDLGFYIAYPKVQDPSTRSTYLGFEIDTVEMFCSPPKEKLCKIYRELKFWRDENGPLRLNCSDYRVHCVMLVGL